MSNYIWGRPTPVPDQCSGPHTYGPGCTYNAEDHARPPYPEELRPGAGISADDAA
ncbi:hypothetical protein GCM10027169_29830 [Gordonia jinhuaensis]|uniref:Uncharacterized protein n=1 Tax=Gordonia jinhuaensis TaxID=1517702 RepID=A0A916T5H5_9ACTN|nr:hypothetical protein [Gordonia jinhuaensis]GGB32645.1 hypothetical protein GCM10011489_21030 [Gordonia jinhuaensis]